MSQYQSFGEYIGTEYVNIESQDIYPFYNQWRGRPLSDTPYIRNNVAGYYPYPKTKRTIQVRPEPKWEFSWGYAPSTVFPSNPQYQATKESILER
jgi:hypothetical protein